MKISVITATFNSGATLRDTIESVLNQTYDDIEYLIVDGASCDNTIEIVEQYEPKFNGRMRWISEPDRGIYDAMNKGISMATGEIIGILNSDDFYSSPHVLERVVAEIQDVDAVYGDIHYVNKDNLKTCIRYYSSKYFRRWMMRLGFMPAHPSFYCHRKIYTDYGLFDINFIVAADFEQLLRLIYIHRILIKYIPMDFVTMRTAGASSSGMVSHKKIIRDHIRAYKKNKVYSNYLLEGIRYTYKILEIGNYRLKHILKWANINSNEQSE